MLPSRGRIKIPVHPERGDVEINCNDVVIHTNVPTTPLMQAYHGRSFKERVCKHLLHCVVCVHRFRFDFRACILRIIPFTAQCKGAHYGSLVKWYHIRFIPLCSKFDSWGCNQAYRQRYKYHRTTEQG